MASTVEALSLGLPHHAAIPAADARRIVDVVQADLKPSDTLTRADLDVLVGLTGPPVPHDNH